MAWISKVVCTAASTFFLTFGFVTVQAATPLTVVLTGGFANQSYTFDYGNGVYDEITVSATVNLTFYPSSPSCDDTKFSSSTAQITGSIRAWGTAKRFQPGSTLTKNFDHTFTYNAASGTAAPIHYEGQSGTGGILDLHWQIPTSINANDVTPYAVHYDGASRVLRLWLALPSPFRYLVNDEYYDSAGTATVSGQSNVNSCLVGTVTAAETGQPLVGAGVSFGNVIRTTDAAGGFFYGNIPANTYRLIVTSAGYYPYTNMITIPAFSIVGMPVVPAGPQLKVFDANRRFLGGVFLKGAGFPLDANGIWWADAVDALGHAVVPRAGIVADGSSQLLLRFESDYPGTVTFTHQNVSVGVLARIDGTTEPENVATTLIGDKHMAFALYSAPDMLVKNADVDQLRASFTPTGPGQSVQISTSITLRRAPVLLVHGVWGKPDTWDTLSPQLEAHGFDTCRVNYFPNEGLKAAGSFKSYLGVVGNGAANLISRERSLGLAASRVDVVAHSMGGILTRLDVNGDAFRSLENNFQGNIRRIVTIDTPHYGSRGATVLLDLTAKNPAFKRELEKSNHPVEPGGGVSDLDPRTFAQSVAGHGNHTLIGATHGLTYAICATASDQTDLPAKEERKLLSGAGWFLWANGAEVQRAILCNQTTYLGEPAISIANKVFTSPQAMQHDGIVPLESQAGGCVATMTFAHVAHTAAPKNISVIQQVVTLLRSDGGPFAASGFPEVTTANTSSQICELEVPTVNSIPAQLVRLDYVPSLISASPGSSVTFSLNTLPGATVDRVLVTALQNGIVITDLETTNLPSAFTFAIPTNSLGAITVLATAVNSSQQIHLLETNVFVQPPGAIQSLAVAPQSLTFGSIGESGEITVSGTFLGGSIYDVAFPGSGTSYTSTAPGVATVDSNGVVTAVAQGAATVLVSNGHLSTNIPVNVSLQVPTILSVTPFSTPPGVTNLPFTLVGSALGGATKIEIFKNGILDSSVAVTNATIGAAGLNVTAMLTVKSNASPGLRTVAITTPAGRSTLADSPANRFFVGAPLQINDFRIVPSTTSVSRILLHLAGLPDGVSVLQSSTNLVDWTALATNSLLGGDWYFDQVMPTNSRVRFYRAALVPSD